MTAYHILLFIYVFMLSTIFLIAMYISTLQLKQGMEKQQEGWDTFVNQLEDYKTKAASYAEKDKQSEIFDDIQL